MTWNSLEDQQIILKQMAQLLAKSAVEAVADWAVAFYDFRADGDTGSGLSRTIVKSEATRQWIMNDVNFGNIFVDLGRLRDAGLTDKWYGFMLLVKRSGEVEVKFSYDPDFIDSFDEDEDQHLPY